MKLRNLGLGAPLAIHLVSLGCTPTSVPGAIASFLYCFCFVTRFSGGRIKIKIKRVKFSQAREGKEGASGEGPGLPCQFFSCTLSYFFQPIFAIVFRRHSKPKPRVGVSLNRSQLRPDPTATERFSTSRCPHPDLHPRPPIPTPLFFQLSVKRSNFLFMLPH